MQFALCTFARRHSVDKHDPTKGSSSKLQVRKAPRNRFDTHDPLKLNGCIAHVADSHGASARALRHTRSPQRVHRAIRGFLLGTTSGILSKQALHGMPVPSRTSLPAPRWSPGTSGNPPKHKPISPRASQTFRNLRQLKTHGAQGVSALSGTLPKLSKAKNLIRPYRNFRAFWLTSGLLGLRNTSLLAACTSRSIQMSIELQYDVADFPSNK